jgi:hypothetical protein
MSAKAPAATYEDLSSSNTRLQEQLVAAQAALEAATAQKPKKPSAVGGALKRVGRAVWAAVASTDAVKQEKSLAVLIVTRLLISAGAAEGTVKLVQFILASLGGKV